MASSSRPGSRNRSSVCVNVVNYGGGMDEHGINTPCSFSLTNLRMEGPTESTKRLVTEI